MDLNDFLVTNDQSTEIASCDIYVDEEGEWFHHGIKIIREDFLEFFYDHISLSEENQFLIEWKNTQCTLQVADTPFVISRVDRVSNNEENDEILLTLRHVRDPEPLAPETLRVGEQNILYCRIRNTRFPARFSRPAYYQLAEWIKDDPDTGQFFIELSQTRYYIGT